MTTAAETVLSGGEPAPSKDSVIELTDIHVRFDVPTERILSFKEYMLKRLTTRMERRELWALQGIDLKVGSGEVLGIVGRNGAGKSTLLKVVSRVLRPTKGRVVIRGRVTPLLELGAGFHFDLTGRENVFLNAALLGHPRRVVADRLQQVVDFSELHEFFDVPIRNYSTGMLARLGFAVATMVRPDLLLVDEVLAVGDAAFQVKCLERIERFRAQGTTILLVSHQSEQVADYCDRALWLEEGRVEAIGQTREVLARYLEALTPERA